VNRLERARVSLIGLSVGDAFGETFFTRKDAILEMVRARRPAPGPWPWTDDTAMAISIVEELAQRSSIDPDGLAERFARRHALEPLRGYGAGAHDLLSRIWRGESWRDASRRLFGGAGSFGNGAAMRVAPLGAFFADDLDGVVVQAARSAEVTHAHEEGIAGAIAVAVAAAETWRTRQDEWDRERFFRAVITRTPAGYTRQGIKEAEALPIETTVVEAALALAMAAA
jgi:ADP-ribosylglycohydrolase